MIGQIGTPNITFDLFTSSENACPVYAYKIYEYETLIISDYL